MTDTDQALRQAQDLMLERARGLVEAGATRVGWKVGHAIPEIEQAFGQAFVVGAITSATTLDSGGVFAAGHAQDLRAETEVAVHIGADVLPTCGASALRHAIAGIGVALELVDVARPPGGAEAIIAGNSFHRAAVLGRGLAPLATRLGAARLVVDDRTHPADEQYPEIVSVIGSVVALLARSGEHLRAGDVVLTGSVAHQPVAIGVEVTAEIEPLGRVGVSISR